MTVLIFGIGVGLFSTLCLWAVSVILYILSCRIQKNFGPAFLAVTLIITLTLIIIPRESENEDTGPTAKVYDGLFFWKIAIIIFLAVSVVFGFICYLFTDLMVPCYVQPIKQWRL